MVGLPVEKSARVSIRLIPCRFSYSRCGRAVRFPVRLLPFPQKSKIQVNSCFPFNFSFLQNSQINPHWMLLVQCSIAIEWQSFLIRKVLEEYHLSLVAFLCCSFKAQRMPDPISPVHYYQHPSRSSHDSYKGHPTTLLTPSLALSYVYIVKPFINWNCRCVFYKGAVSRWYTAIEQI